MGNSLYVEIRYRREACSVCHQGALPLESVLSLPPGGSPHRICSQNCRRNAHPCAVVCHNPGADPWGLGGMWPRPTSKKLASQIDPKSLLPPPPTSVCAPPRLPLLDTPLQPAPPRLLLVRCTVCLLQIICIVPTGA